MPLFNPKKDIPTNYFKLIYETVQQILQIIQEERELQTPSGVSTTEISLQTPLQSPTDEKTPHV